MQTDDQPGDEAVHPLRPDEQPNLDARVTLLEFLEQHLREQPPQEAGPLLDLIGRLRVEKVMHRVAAEEEGVSSFLRPQTNVMEAMRAGALQPWQVSQTMETILASFALSPPTKLPDLTLDDVSGWEAVRALLPHEPDQLAELEQSVQAASADPENRRIVARIGEHLPNRAQLAQQGPWVVFAVVAIAMLKMANDVTSNQLMMLTIILMVVLWVLPPPSSDR